MTDTFRKTIARETEILKAAKSRFNLLGYIRLALLVLFIACLYFMITRWDLTLYKVEAAILLVVHIIAGAYHSRLDDGVKKSAAIIDINKRNLDRVEGRWTEFKDTGEEFKDPEHPYCNDLDIVGKKSLFQYLNVSHTWHGRKAFSQDLLHASYTGKEIKARQEAANELASDSSFADELEYRFAKIGSDRAAPALVTALQDSRPLTRHTALRALLMFGPLALLVLVALVVLLRLEQLYLLSACLYAVQALIWIFGLPVTGKYLDSISRLPFKLECYGEVLAFVSEAPFKSERLRKVSLDLTASDVSATQAIAELAKIADKMSARNNFIIYFILNTLFLWDFSCALRFEDWKKQYSPHCEGWFLCLGELESLSCLATFRRVCDHTCFPEFSHPRHLQAQELGHPLIPNAVRVNNPLGLSGDIVIISGSNMSGKTTYLRTVGINVVLARAGAPVCAKSMVFSDLHIVTSMRIADDLGEGISTFYAELTRIKAILDAAQSDRSTLFLIDEIFRGTNSVDRLSGAQTVIKKLSELHVSGMITTHDLELCDMAAGASCIRNYSFAEYYKDGQICFDYKMRPGKSKTTNAKYLMELLGIV